MLLYVFVILMLLRTSFTDPGIIPRATDRQSKQIEAQMTEEEQRNSNHTGYRPPVSFLILISLNTYNSSTKSFMQFIIILDFSCNAWIGFNLLDLFQTRQFDRFKRIEIS